jgi:SAM-dependent methyltransferase
LGVEDPGIYSANYPQIKTVQYDGKIFPFADKAFDICWSNGVIEHVGYYDRQLLFMKEIHRVSKRAYITTPNRCFPIEIHSKLPFVHYLPKPWFDKVARFFNKHWVLGDKLNPLAKRQLVKILKDAGITKYEIHPNWFGPFIVDYIVIFE